MSPIRVFIIDDSALIRGLLAEILNADPEIDVVGAASNPVAAWPGIKATRPDVLTLDVEMPRMDGLTFLDKLMAAHPLPVVMVSSLTEKGCATTLQALEAGAVDFVAKPKIDIQAGTVALADEIVAKVKGAARARVRRAASSASLRQRAPIAMPQRQLSEVTHRLIAIGASTGGTEALKVVLSAMPAAAPGIVVVQHMPAQFTRAFADRLNGLCDIEVREAKEGDRVLPGLALIAPGNHHMHVRKSGAEYRVAISSEAPVNRHRPSVDVLFDSCARAAAHNAVGVILTGMGNDGAQGMRRMHDAGAHTIAQDEATCVVYGMPREAVLAGGVDRVLPLDDCAGAAVNAALSPTRSMRQAV
ncbi:MAG TPA: chemotaxis response regulator protein-glutamate methylesterase [Gemmatimonadaceae bacterium]|jgi:two-component system chemotaxis response regulator CheB